MKDSRSDAEKEDEEVQASITRMMRYHDDEMTILREEYEGKAGDGSLCLVSGRFRTER